MLPASPLHPEDGGTMVIRNLSILSFTNLAQGFSWKVDSYPYGQNFLPFIEPKISLTLCPEKFPPFDTIISQINPVQKFTNCLSKICLNNVLLSTLIPTTWSLPLNGICKEKVKLSQCFLLIVHHAINLYWGSGGIAPRNLDLGTIRRWVVS
jgi:hypothetical protein